MKIIMNYVTSHVFILSILAVNGFCQTTEDEEPVVPHPYSFSYAAGRAPGHTDRIHSETSDGTGIIRGKFSYIDPRQKVRTVEYVADQNGFHPILITNPIQDTQAVAQAKEKHAALYERIAAEQQRIALERGQTDYDDGRYKEEIQENNPYIILNVKHPRDTPVVENAKLKHLNLFQRIAEEHARIAAERKIPETDGEESLRYNNPVY